MNKNKIIFIIIGALITMLIIFIIMNLEGGNSKTRGKKVQEYSIWIMGDKTNDFEDFISDFKNLYKPYKNTQFKVESFSNYEEYYYSLFSAILAGKAPDLFILNNNEVSLFEEQISGIDSSVISINDFRKKYKSVFSDDLIANVKVGDKNIEFLKGIPVGYETLGIFYNRKHNIKPSDLSTISALSNTISRLKTKYPNKIPLGMGDGKSVVYSNDIITQFFLFEKDISGINDLNTKEIRSALSSYMIYGDIELDNRYKILSKILETSGGNNLDLFSDSKISMIVGYPRMINEIYKRGYGKNYLDAIIFPHNGYSGGKTLINYNYFVINKDSKSINLGIHLLKYMTTKDGITSYIDKFPYYLPANRDVESELLESKISTKYNIILKDFYNSDFELSSFDKGVINIYDKEIIKILDTENNYISKYEELNTLLKCKKNKFLKLENLSVACE